jgi:hypothetical protein
MGSSSKHILDKIDRIRAKGDQRRADSIANARFAPTSLYQPATNYRVFTEEEVTRSKIQFQKEIKKRDKREAIIWIGTLVMTPVCFYLAYLFMKIFQF